MVTANGSRGGPQGECNRNKPPGFYRVRMERRGKSSPAQWRHCGSVNPTRSNIRMGHYVEAPHRPGEGVSPAATHGQDRSSFNTEPGLRSGRFPFYQKQKLRRKFEFPAQLFCFTGDAAAFISTAEAATAKSPPVRPAPRLQRP